MMNWSVLFVWKCLRMPTIPSLGCPAHTIIIETALSRGSTSIISVLLVDTLRCSAFLGITSCVAFPIASKKNGRSATMNRHDIHTVAVVHPVCSFIVWISFINIDAAAGPEAATAVPEAAVAVVDIVAIWQITNIRVSALHNTKLELSLCLSCGEF